MRLILQLAAIVAISFLGGVATQAVQGNPILTFLAGIVSAALALLVYRWVVRRTERRIVTEAGAKGAFSGLGIGVVIGIALFGAVIGNIALLGAYRLEGMGSGSGLIGLLGFMAAAAVTEELLYRGVLFRIIEERTGTWIAMTITAIVFGGSHLLNPHATLWGAIAIAIEAGVLLVAAYVATRKLWLPIGIHFGWNIAASGIFSTTVSGADTPQGLLEATLSGPELITGGAFGPEGSIYSVGLCLIASVVLFWVAKRRGHIVPLRRRARATTEVLASA